MLNGDACSFALADAKSATSEELGVTGFFDVENTVRSETVICQNHMNSRRVL